MVTQSQFPFEDSFESTSVIGVFFVIIGTALLLRLIFLSISHKWEKNEEFKPPRIIEC
jgi:hypothetical protein